MKCDELKIYHCNEWQNEYTEFYLKSDVDTAIDELKAEINHKEGVGQRWFERCMEARTENVKLKRALYNACANWAHIAVAFFSSYATKEKWRKMENKCREKAEEYK